MLAFLRTTTPWYVPLIGAVAIAIVTGTLGMSKFTTGEQAAAGAAAGALAAMALMIRFYEKRHPDEIWRPHFDIRRAQKLAGAAAAAAGLVDLSVKFVNPHYALITGIPVLLLTWFTAALLQAQKLTRLKENEQWTS